MVIIWFLCMTRDSYSMNELAETTSIEPRTIRSYIERGLLPNAGKRGRGARYSTEHLARLRTIQGLRRARPGITLNDIRILLQQLKPEQIHRLARGSITAVASAISEPVHQESDLPEGNFQKEYFQRETETDVGVIDWSQIASSMTGVERLVRLLREVSGVRSPTPKSRIENWTRIAVTQDFELSVRADFAAGQLVAFRELADLLRHLFENTHALPEASHD